jgi:hypothetical protein
MYSRYVYHPWNLGSRGITPEYSSVWVYLVGREGWQRPPNTVVQNEQDEVNAYNAFIMILSSVI